MEFDIDSYVAACPICQCSKGGTERRHTIKIREITKPGEHVMADYMGPFFKKYYILILIDYFSGYSVLLPTESCGAISTSEGILNNWIKYFGWFDTFDSDLGSAFISRVTSTILESAKVKHNFAEPRYHNRIGKVERVIGFIQQILRTYNIEYHNNFITMDDPQLQWTTIKSIIPFIQFGINNRISRFTTFSPAMLFLGSNLRDIPDLNFAIKKIKQGMRSKGIKEHDFDYLNEFQLRLKKMQLQHKNNWIQYCKVSQKQYDKRYNLAPKRDKDGKLIPPTHSFGFQSIDKFKKGAKVLYYAGPHRPGINHKWRQKWTGPWYISHKTGKYNVKIIDKKGKGYDVDIDRLKLFKTFKNKDIMKYTQFEDMLEKMKKDKPNYEYGDQ